MIKIIEIKNLKAHERTDRINLERVRAKIKQAKYFTCPIIVDKNNFIILDGHHRTLALTKLGFTKIPVLMVNYCDKKIRVFSRRENYKITKEIIIKNALASKLLPKKTSKHLIPNRPKNFKINLEKLL